MVVQVTMLQSGQEKPQFAQWTHISTKYLCLVLVKSFFFFYNIITNLQNIR